MSEHDGTSCIGPPGPAPTVRRRRLAIRAAVVVGLAVPIVCIGAVCYPFFSRWRAQQPAVAAIEKLGGEVQGPPWAPKYVTLPQNVSDADVCSLVESLLAFRSLHKVTITGAGITENGIKCLKPVSRLAVLDLRGTAITPEGIVAIRQTLPDVEIREPVPKPR